MGETGLRWSADVQKRPIDPPVKKCDGLKVLCI